jgi:hypothetical protein
VSFDIAQINLGPDTTLCFGDSIILKAPAGYNNYRWQDNSTDTLINAKNSGIYMLSARSSLGCLVRDTVAVNVKPWPAAPEILADTVICQGDTLFLAVQGAPDAKFTWFSPDGLQFDADSLRINPGEEAREGAWRVTQTLNGCPGPEGTVTIRIDPSPQPLIKGDTTICEGEFAELSAPGDYLSWLWSNGQTTSGILQDLAPIRYP